MLSINSLQIRLDYTLWFLEALFIYLFIYYYITLFYYMLYFYAFEWNYIMYIQCFINKIIIITLGVA